jgi:hypothetical protein
MRFITTAIKYFVTANYLISIGYAFPYFGIAGAIKGTNITFQKVASTSLKQRYSQLAATAAARSLADNPTLFQHFCSKIFMQPVPLGSRQSSWVSYANDANNIFLEFMPSHSGGLCNEIQITTEDVWFNLSTFNTAPRADLPSKDNVFVHNLILDPNCLIDRTVLFSRPKRKDDTGPYILGVSQIGLGADRLQTSTDPETKACLRFLTQPKSNHGFYEHIPDSVAADYKILGLSLWSPGANDTPQNTLLPQKPLTEQELADITAIIGFCLTKEYPIATMLKYTGLPLATITNILTSLRDNR